MRHLPSILTALLSAALLYSCASIGNPSGGPRDEDPPRFVGAYPPQEATNVTATKMQIIFNELVNVKDAFSKVVVSPYSKEMAKVTSSGRRVTVDFPDTLLPNTTYTVDFADAIEDNNEANQLTDFTYTFSTGPELDTLRMSGIVLSARDLEPQQGILVGAYEDLSDTAFTKTPLLRIARTDDRGRFTIRGLKSTLYKIYALDDKDADYRYANPEEDLAFYDAVMIPSSYPEETLDTIWDLRNARVDTTVTRMRTVFLPNDILLRTFNVELKPQYILNYNRQDSTRLHINFNSKQQQPPRLSLIDRALEAGKDYVLERSATNDTLTYWLKNPELILNDSLYVATTYLRLDSADRPVDFTDTLDFIHNRPKPSKQKDKDKKKGKPNIVTPPSAQDSIRAITLDLKFISNSTLDVNLPAVFEFATPLDTLDLSKIHLRVEKDTSFVAVTKPFRVLPYDSVAVRRFKVEYPWDYESKYQLEFDTIAAVGIYGKPTRPQSFPFQTKPEEDYCALTLRIQGFEPGEHAFVELLDGSDKVVRAATVDNSEAYFPFLQPGKYYARIVEDFNGNGRYDTGDFSKKLKPDQVFYYPKAINLKKNWDKTEQWDVWATAIDLQKPEALKKNKPASTKRAKARQQEQEEEEEEE